MHNQPEPADAVNGQPKNAKIIKTIVSQFPEVPVQVGGGIRDDATVESYLEAGVQFVIIGTRAVNEPHFGFDPYHVQASRSSDTPHRR